MTSPRRIGYFLASCPGVPTARWPPTSSPLATTPTCASSIRLALVRSMIPLRWQEVADWSGRVFHPLAQFEKMSIPVTPNPGPPPFDSAPWLGRLSSRQSVNVLVGELAKLTRTPSNCYFAIWDGGGITDRR